MANVIQSKSHLEKFIVSRCCFYFPLRTGSLIIGVAQVIIGILWLIGGTSIGSSGYSGIISTLLMIAAGGLTIYAIRKESVRFLWYAVYINISIGIWLVIFIVIMFITLHWGLAIGGIINCVLTLYFASVLRSFAFELEDGVAAGGGTNPV